MTRFTSKVTPLSTHPSRLITYAQSPPTKDASNVPGVIEDDELAKMKQEIEQLRAEALKRVDALSKEVAQVEEEVRSKIPSIQSETPVPAARTTSDRKPTMVDKEELLHVWEQNPPHATAAKNETVTQTTRQPLMKSMPMQVEKKGDLDLLDGTHWKIMLNIGREPGTWMSKTWGVSGDRLLLNLEVCFEGQQLYERDDFLMGIGNAKVCRVVHHELSIAPTLMEGSRQVTLKDGGWRIAKGEGPLGTDLLRFFIETDSEIRHSGGDVYVPPGRIYCSCGFFLMHRPSGIKDQLRERMTNLEERREEIEEELQEEGFLSMKRMKLSKELFDIGWKEAEIRKTMNEADVVEPDKGLLRVSKKGDVGLTREGGVCCKVQKGPVVEYHILGRFSVAAIEPREE